MRLRLSYKKWEQLLLISLILITTSISCSNKSKIATSVNKANNSNSNSNDTKPNSKKTVAETNKSDVDKNELKINDLIERDLVGGEIHSYLISSQENQYLNVVVEQKGIDVVVSVDDPNGKKVYELDSPNGTKGPEPIYLITSVSGTHRLEIRSLEKGAKMGKYEVKIIEMRPSTAIDEDRIEGFKALAEAETLKAEGNVEKLELAIKKYEEAISKLEKALELELKADAAEKLGTLYYNQEKSEKALEFFLLALDLYKKKLGSKHIKVASANSSLGTIYQDLREYKKAETFYLESLEIYREVKGENSLDVGDVYSELGILSQNLGKYNEAELFLGKTLDIYKKSLGEEDLATARVLNSLADVYIDKGDYIKAEKFHLEALAIRRKVAGENNFATTVSLNNLALLYLDKGEYQKAEVLLIEALEVRKKILMGDNSNIALSLGNLGELYSYKGEYQKAEPLYIQALEMYKALFGESNANSAIVLNNLGGLYLDKGDYEKAESCYQQALKINKELLGENHPETANCMSGLGKIYRLRKDYDKAETFYVKALEIRKTLFGDKHPAVASSINNLSFLYKSKRDYGKAEALLIEALEINKKTLGENSSDTSLALNNLAGFYLDKGDYEKAEAFFLQSLEIRKKTLGESHPNTGVSLNNLARLYYKKGDYKKALKYTKETNEVREKELSKNLLLGSERQRQLYLKQYILETDRSLSLHIQLLPNDLVALECAVTEVLRRKGRSIDITNQAIDSLRKRSAPEDLILLDELAEKKRQLSNFTVQGAKKLDFDEYQKQLKSLQSEVELLEYKISERNATFGSELQEISLKAIQTNIPKDAILVEFATYSPYDAKTDSYREDNYAVYLLGNQGNPIWFDLGKAKPIDNLIDKLRIKLSNKTSNINKEIKPLARELDKLIMEPVRRVTGKEKRLLVSPDGKLNLIPFTALVDEKGRFLVENYSISYLTSGRDLLRLEASKKNSLNNEEPPIIFANPDYGKGNGPILLSKKYLPLNRLKGTEEEALGIKEELKNAVVYLNEKADEKELKNIKHPQILHIATHGYFLESKENKDPNETKNNEGKKSDTKRLFVNEEITPEQLRLANPLLRSGLFFANANNSDDNKINDGVLTALETTTLDLFGTKLVVLSACDTGVGEVKTGDGVYGLRRSLLLAGSETQVISLWPVSDEGTKELMVEYYKRLQKREGRADALQNVQLDLLKSSTRRHPFYWASFIQSGEWANLDGKR